jgi:hypothetical protein
MRRGAASVDAVTRGGGVSSSPPVSSTPSPVASGAARAAGPQPAVAARTRRAIRTGIATGGRGWAERDRGTASDHHEGAVLGGERRVLDANPDDGVSAKLPAFHSALNSAAVKGPCASPSTET